MNLDAIFQILLGIFAFVVSSIVGIGGWFVRQLTARVAKLMDGHNAHSVRISVAENRIDGIEQRLKSIENKLDRIYSLLQRNISDDEE